jgi:hypothetical protein
MSSAARRRREALKIESGTAGAFFSFVEGVEGSRWRREK